MASSVLPPRPQGSYTYTSQPRAIGQRKKYRNDPDAAPHQIPGSASTSMGNVMYDRRVVRGNTWARQRGASAIGDPVEAQRRQFSRRSKAARARAREQLRDRTPPPVTGREHKKVQTELYLEELVDKVEEDDVECQTDYFIDRPPTPLFVPTKTGVDVFTQIEDGDLFNFDIEVKPILEVLVGKTIEQALLEVMEEEELFNLRKEQRMFEELRSAELIEQQRLEEQERRHREEKERRMKQAMEVVKLEKETKDKLAARAFAMNYLNDLIPAAFTSLADGGFFHDPIEQDVEENFMTWLMDNVADSLDRSLMSRTILDGVVREVVTDRTEVYNKLYEKLHQESGNPPIAEPLVETESIIDVEFQPEEDVESQALAGLTLPEPDLASSFIASEVSSFNDEADEDMDVFASLQKKDLVDIASSSKRPLSTHADEASLKQVKADKDEEHHIGGSEGKEESTDSEQQKTLFGIDMESVADLAKTEEHPDDRPEAVADVDRTAGDKDVSIDGIEHASTVAAGGRYDEHQPEPSDNNVAEPTVSQEELEFEDINFVDRQGDLKTSGEEVAEMYPEESVGIDLGADEGMTATLAAEGSVQLEATMPGHDDAVPSGQVEEQQSLDQQQLPAAHDDDDGKAVIQLGPDRDALQLLEPEGADHTVEFDEDDLDDVPDDALQELLLQGEENASSDIDVNDAGLFGSSSEK